MAFQTKKTGYSSDMLFASQGEFMRAHYLQHVPFEGLGSIAPWLNDNDYETTSTGFFQSTELPDPDAIDVLIVMGGSMSANDERLFPWLVAEKAFLRHFIQSGKPLLGICLGAQLIASALGARLFSNRFKEIGWFPVHRVEAADVNAFSFPAATEVFHWHGETFDLPQGARLIGANDACRHQAFQVGDSVIGFQFHLETTPAVA
jgi:GMP synthase-like glutamine amidotransferase